jgi:hypothetical protein
LGTGQDLTIPRASYEKEYLVQQKNIEPHKVTKPIQLLAAWLAGLVLVNGTFLGSAVVFEVGSQERFWLTVASIINVPLFLGAIFLLQTKFRPELQEDSYYSSYLDKKTRKITEVSPIEEIRNAINELKSELQSFRFALNEMNKEDSILEEEELSVALSNSFSGFKEVSRMLKELGITDVRLFKPGSAGNKPSKLHITMNPELPFHTKIAILKIGAEYNFDSYSYDAPDSINPEDIFIGGFGYDRESPDYPFNEDLKQLLKNSPSKDTLDDFESGYETA